MGSSWAPAIYRCVTFKLESINYNNTYSKAVTRTRSRALTAATATPHEPQAQHSKNAAMAGCWDLGVNTKI